MDLMTMGGHAAILSAVIALMGGVRFHIRIERNSNRLRPHLRFRIWIDKEK